MPDTQGSIGVQMPQSYKDVTLCMFLLYNLKRKHNPSCKSEQIISGNIISFNHPCVCRIELSNSSCFTVVCKRDYAEFTDTVRQRGLESLLRHTKGD